MAFKCLRDGRCCQQDENGNPVASGLWLGSPLTWDEKQQLLAKRKTLPENVQGCAMLYFKNEIAICLVEELFGKEKKESCCRDYPKVGETCLCGIKNS